MPQTSARSETGSKPQETRPIRSTVVVKELIHEQILPHLRADIVSNRWEPGERLPEPLLCAEFGISRTPLREAFKILEADGLVELRPHVGAVVTPLNPPDLADKFEVLAGLEQLAASKVARMRKPETLDRIEELQAAMVAAASAGEVARYYSLNDEFHRALVLGAENQALAQLHEKIMLHLHRARHRVTEYEPLSKSAARRHDAIITHILHGDEDAAGRAARKHLEDVAAAVVSKLESAAR